MEEFFPRPKNLPKGWELKVVRRISGKSEGHRDIYIYSPDGCKFRSKNEVKNYFERNKITAYNLDNFNFSVRDLLSEGLPKSEPKKSSDHQNVLCSGRDGKRSRNGTAVLPVKLKTVNGNATKKPTAKKRPQQQANSAYFPPPQSEKPKEHSSLRRNTSHRLSELNSQAGLHENTKERKPIQPRGPSKNARTLNHKNLSKGKGKVKKKSKSTKKKNEDSDLQRALADVANQWRGDLDEAECENEYETESLSNSSLGGLASTGSNSMELPFENEYEDEGDRSMEERSENESVGIVQNEQFLEQREVVYQEDEDEDLVREEDGECTYEEREGESMDEKKSVWVVQDERFLEHQEVMYQEDEGEGMEGVREEDGESMDEKESVSVGVEEEEQSLDGEFEDEEGEGYESMEEMEDKEESVSVEEEGQCLEQEQVEYQREENAEEEVVEEENIWSWRHWIPIPRRAPQTPQINSELSNEQDHSSESGQQSEQLEDQEAEQCHDTGNSPEREQFELETSREAAENSDREEEIEESMVEMSTRQTEGEHEPASPSPCVAQGNPNPQGEGVPTEIPDSSRCEVDSMPEMDSVGQTASRKRSPSPVSVKCLDPAKKPRLSTYFSKPKPVTSKHFKPTNQDENPPVKEILEAVVWAPPKSPYNLIQESLYREPWKLLIATIFLNRTAGKVAIPLVWKFFERWPTPEAAYSADKEELAAFLQPLGLNNRRAEQIMRFSHDFCHKQWLYPKELYGIDKYGNDSFRIFCRNEWRKVKPSDHMLNLYHNWLCQNWRQLGV